MQLPKIGGALGEIKSPEAIAVFTAAILTPIIFPYVTQLLAKIPVLNSHVTTSMLLFALVTFLIASRLKGTARAICIGVAGSFVLIGLGPWIQKYLPNTVVP